MFIHTVFFWLNEGLEEKDLGLMEEGLHALLKIPTVHGGYWGKPANTPRDVVDNSYHYALTVLFDDRENHAIYQEDERHLTFLGQCASMWSTVKVYDYLTGK